MVGWVMEVHGTRSWRPLSEVSSSKDFSFSHDGDDAGASFQPKEKVVRIVMGSLTIVDWMRGQWLLGLFALSILLAYYSPASDTTAGAWAHILVFVSLVLSGASLPNFGKSTTPRCMGSCVIMCVMSFIVSPLMGTALYFTFSESSGTNYLFFGLMCTLCLSPSATLSVAAAHSSQGDGAFSQHLSAIGTVCGVIVSPLLVLLCISLSHAVTFSNTSELTPFSVILIAPFCFGVVAQKGLTWLSHCLRRGEENEIVRLDDVDVACTESYLGTRSYWRRRAIQLNYIVLFLVNYFMFSLFFVHSVVSSLLTWRGVVTLVGVELLFYVVFSLVGWLVASMVVWTPEERIALFFALTTKSEILLVPIVFHLFHESGHAAAVLFPSLVYHLFQAVAAGVLSVPLRRWRYRYNCRPGTALLPLRLSRK